MVSLDENVVLEIVVVGTDSMSIKGGQKPIPMLLNFLQSSAILPFRVINEKKPFSLISL